MSFLSRLLPTRLTTGLARHAIPIAIGVLGILLLAGIAAAALVSPGALGITAARLSDTTSLDDVVAGGLEERDTDNDGLSDSLENYVYGTDPANWDTAGIGIPDGWLVQFGFDPLDPLTRDARGKAPPTESLPVAYADGYPKAYTPPLSVYYNYAKPREYQPGVDAPWWRGGAEHADPVAADPTQTGIPVGWLLYHGVPLRELDPSRAAPGTAGNLTIREAFEHDTDPFELDSDGDGLDDWTEIEATKTDPSKFSSAGVGIADGWLLRFGLNAFDANVATQDPDRDGLTNYEEFNTSWEALRAERLSQGPQILYTKGLNPLEWQTAQTGIPDGWYVKYGLSPFGTDVDRLIGKASDFAEYRTYTPEGEQALPDITFTVRGAYEYARPDDWNESTKGVWWGGTNPVTLDSDADGLPDPVEIRGWYANVTFDTGPEAKPRVYLATSNPLEPDSDGDGLNDDEEYRGRSDCGTTTERAFPPTDPRNRDTAFSLLSDFEKVCGIVRGDARYQVASSASAPGLDPTKADSAGDHIKDGARVDFWHVRAEALKANPRYPYNGSAYRTVYDWTEKYPRFGSLSRDQVLAQFRPDGDVDNDGLVNVADPDPSGGLYAEKFDVEGTPRTKVYFLGGPEIDPAAYRLTEFSSTIPHTATDPANPDTDGDGLPDSWETRYGTFDAAKGGWNLDPAKADSDGDGVTDDKANNDNDIVTWYAFDRRGAAIERSTRTFTFNNALEFLAGTDPNTVSSADDGVPDGWKAFWGSRITGTTYPNLLGSRDASVGSLALDSVADIEAAIAASAIDPASNLKNQGTKASGYVRFVNVSSCPADVTSLLKPGERAHDVNPCFQGENLDSNLVKIARILGAKKLTYADEARLRTNPFMPDTDGDGAPDAYEAYYSQRTATGSSHPDPVVDDRARDPDGDGLGIDEECGTMDAGQCSFESFRVDDETLGAGADPNSADTDGDAIQDGIEAGALIDPLDPSDVLSFAVVGKDTDLDGVPDFRELTGSDAKTFFGEPIRTNPKDPDSDNDGLLDGNTTNMAATDPRVANWSARGIAHKTLTNGTIDFLGERTFGTPFGVRPDRLDSGSPGVPDGWIAYHGQNPKERPIDKVAYEKNRPSWWVEATHGVWWWGDVPGVTPPDDADGDGLHDRNGEDPFPGTNRLNRIVDGNLTIVDRADLQAWVSSALGAEAQRLRAQKIGDGAGDPIAARTAALNLVDPSTGILARDLRACTQVVNVSAPTTIEKAVAFSVTGRVVLHERTGGVCGAGTGALFEGSDTARVGLANRTVLVSVMTPTLDRAIGAGFTNATGWFNISANITEAQRLAIPAEGLVLYGSAKGLATNEFDATLLATGAATAGEQNRVLAWVYNTSAAAAPGSPTYALHTARLQTPSGTAINANVNATRFAVSDAIPVTVRASTQIAFEVADTAVNGEKLAGELKLTDASGAPLLDRTVIVNWAGSTTPIELRNLSTDRNGRINLTKQGLPIGVMRADQYALSARFSSADPYLLGTTSALPIQVRNPANLTAFTEVTSATVEEEIVVSGELRTVPVTLPNGNTLASTPVVSAPIALRLGGAEEKATTDPNGRFTIRVVAPGSLSAGAQTIEVVFDGTPTAAPASTTLPLDIKRTAAVIDVNRLEGPRSIEVTLRGRLVDNEGEGFTGAIEVQHEEKGLLARGIAESDGAFTIFVPLNSLELGSQRVRVVFPGDGGHASAENFSQVRVTSTTRLILEQVPDVVVRGSPFGFRARLLDDEDKPIGGQAVGIYWRGERIEARVTDADGTVSFLVPTNVSERPSLASLGAEFTPSANSVFQPATASAPVRVVAGVRLELGEESVARGPITLRGRLLDDEDRPLPGAALAITIDGASLGEARTSRNGSFELLHVLPDSTKLGTHRATARFAGTAALANATREVPLHVRSPIALELTTLGPFVRGEQAPVEGRVVDDRGAPIDAPFHLFLAGRDLLETRATNGNLRAALAVPADAPRGETVLRVFAAPSAEYDGLDEEIPVVIKIRPKVEVELPAIAVRGFAVGGSVTLKDDKGAPLRNTSFAYAIGNANNAVVGATNAEGKGSVAGVAPVAGDSTLALTVRGGPDVVAAQYSTTSMRVVGPATPIGYAALVVAVLVVLLVIGLVVAAIMLRRRQLQEAREILDEAIRDLLAGNEYAGTIFLAYRRFTAYLSRHGFAEKASETPREFATGVRKALPIGAVPLRALIGLFEEARYSDHPIGSQERDRAVESLASVRNELDRLLGQKKVSA